MNRALLRALLVTIPLCTDAIAGAPPQYVAIDLGPIEEPGMSLYLQSPGVVQIPEDPAALPSLGASPPGNIITSEFRTTQAVGSSNFPGGAVHAVTWTWEFNGHVTITDLGVLPGAPAHSWSQANSFTRNGMIVGASIAAFASVHGGPTVHAFLYAGRIIDLNTLAGVGYDSAAYALNDSLEIVGQSDAVAASGSVEQRAFIYAKGVMYDANSLLINTVAAPLTNAVGIDCQGNVAAVADPVIEQHGGRTTHHFYPARACPAALAGLVRTSIEAPHVAVQTVRLLVSACDKRIRWTGWLAVHRGSSRQ
jgi:hypothetical protein